MTSTRPKVLIAIYYEDVREGCIRTYIQTRIAL